jgi:hypothetical protein
MFYHPAATHPFTMTPFCTFVSPLTVMFSMAVTHGYRDGTDSDHSEANGDDRHENEFDLTAMTTGVLIGALVFVVHRRRIAP